MGTTGSLVFTGISSYSSDLQSILQRATSIAQLPVKALQNQQTDNTGKKAALIALNPAVASLGSAVAALGSLAANGGGLSASSTDSTIASVATSGGTTPATFTVSQIQSLASSAWASTGGFTNNKVAVSANGHVDLTFNSQVYHLDLTGNNNLSGLANAINKSGAGVTATILTASSGNYLSLSATSPGQATIQLQDVPTPGDVITNTGTGSDQTIARYADSTTASVSVGRTMSLVVGSTTYQLDLTAAGTNNLTGLQNAINNANAGVTATIASDAKGYYLSISTDDSSTTPLQLDDSSANLIVNSAAGTNADFMLNGNIHVVRPSNAVSDVVPGVTITVKNTTTGTDSATLSLTNDTSQLDGALQTFVNNYNTLVDQVAQQVGTSGGALNGDSLIHDIMTDTQLLATYWNPTSTSSIRSLSDLGITFEDNTGHLTFKQNVFDSLSATQVSDALKFIGSSTSGFAALANNFTQLSDPVTGLIRVQEDGYDKGNTRLAAQITAATDRANQITQAMTAKIQAADALLAQLESEQNTVNASVQSLNYVAFGKNVNSNGQ